MNGLTVRHLLVSTFLLIVIAISFTAQEPGQFLGNAGPLNIYVSDKLCCAPAHASILEENLDRDSTVYYRFRNTGQKPIVGIAVTFSNGEWTRLHYAGFVKRDAALREWVWKGFSAKAGGNLKIEIDFLLFADGTTWGPDTFGRGASLKDFKNGNDLALDRVLKEAVGSPNAQIERLLSTTFGFHAATDIPATGREPRLFRTPFAMGYDGVIANLGRGDEAVKAIASKVRSMPIE